LLTAALTVLAITGLAVMVGPTAANADNGIYTLTNYSGQNCLDVKNGGMNNFDTVDLYRCYYNSGTVESWELISVPQPYHAYLLRNVNSKKCLDVGYGSTAIFASVDQYTCYPDDTSELWHLGAPPGTLQMLQNVNSGQCLDDFYGGMADFTQADQYPCIAGDPAEWWTFR
jgi:pectinesterase